MIKRLRASNYRSLGKDIDLQLGPLAVLVGPNGSGKSNVVDVLSFVSDCMKIGLEGAITKRHGITAIRRWSAAGRPFNLDIHLETEGPEYSGGYSFTLRGDQSADYQVKNESAWVKLDGENHNFEVSLGKFRGPEDLRPRIDPSNLVLPLFAGDERFRPLADELRRAVVYSIFPNALSEPQRYEPTTPMDEHGQNWISILKDMDRTGWKSEFLEALFKLTGDILDLRVESAGGYLIAQFRHGDGKDNKKRAKWFDAIQESDGTLRFAGILTALLQDTTLPVIGIEEPELTIHPGALPLLHDFICQAADHSQVIVTTHSPELLDLFAPDQIHVVEKRNGETTVAPLEDGQKKAVRDRLMSLGEVMRTEGLKQQMTLTL